MENIKHSQVWLDAVERHGVNDRTYDEACCGRKISHLACVGSSDLPEGEALLEWMYAGAGTVCDAVVPEVVAEMAEYNQERMRDAERMLRRVCRYATNNKDGKFIIGDTHIKAVRKFLKDKK